MFWIYGGSLQFGNAGQPTYDGSAFAAYQVSLRSCSSSQLNRTSPVFNPFLKIYRTNACIFVVYQDVIVVSANYRTNGAQDVLAQT